MVPDAFNPPSDREQDGLGRDAVVRHVRPDASLWVPVDGLEVIDEEIALDELAQVLGLLREDEMDSTSGEAPDVDEDVGRAADLRRKESLGTFGAA